LRKVDKSKAPMAPVDDLLTCQLRNSSNGVGDILLYTRLIRSRCIVTWHIT